MRTKWWDTKSPWQVTVSKGHVVINPSVGFLAGSPYTAWMCGVLFVRTTWN